MGQQFARPIYESVMWLYVAITFPNDHPASTCRSNITDREKWPTDGHQASGEFDGSWQVTHLIDWVTKIIQNIGFGRLGVFSRVHLFERLLHPQHWVIKVVLIVGQLAHVEAVIHGQLSAVASPCGQNGTSFITGFRYYTGPSVTLSHVCTLYDAPFVCQTVQT